MENNTATSTAPADRGWCERVDVIGFAALCIVVGVVAGSALTCLGLTPMASAADDAAAARAAVVDDLRLCGVPADDAELAYRMVERDTRHTVTYRDDNGDVQEMELRLIDGGATILRLDGDGNAVCEIKVLP